MGTEERIKKREAEIREERKQLSQFHENLALAREFLQTSLKAKAKGYKWMYCPLHQVLAATNETCKRYKFFFNQYIETYHNKEETGSICVLKTILTCSKPDFNTSESHDYIINSLPIPSLNERQASKDILFSIGKEITYLRRYSIYITFGIMPEDHEETQFENKGFQKSPIKSTNQKREIERMVEGWI